MKRPFKITGRVLLLASLLSFASCFSVSAEEHFITGKCRAEFPEAMSYLQSLIKEKGYLISRIQKVDKGLRSRGFQTGLYRVVFFGKKNEIEEVSLKHPELIPYIPLNITIYEIPPEIGISAIDPVAISPLYKSKHIQKLINVWHKDIMDVFSQYHRCEF